MKKQKYWYKLDNAGKIFPAVSQDERSNVFRLSFYLDETIDSTLLEEAVNKVLPRFET
ncbi:MAG TPA: alcohol acetyltransferase, partial [Acholeplasmataceae bacterium]|nr:alcohol acetyltransferase [Acholeplasmataceae bacterium]